MSPYIVHFAYFVMLCAFLVRDVLVLRALLVSSQMVVVIYTWNIGVPTIAGWNALFMTINTTWIVLILRERRVVKLPAELRQLYNRHFAALSTAEFLRLWTQGRREVLRDVVLARAGEAPGSLYFLLAGTARVSRRGAHITDLPPGCFVAEMSLLTGALPEADVVAIGEIEVMRWPTPQLKAMKERSPAFWNKIQSVLGRDIVEKLKRGAEAQARLET